MFFPELIRNIGPDDKVLEIGPGGLPHPRADVFLELSFNNSLDETMQRGYAEKPKLDKPIVYYDGRMFPFSDREFDYVICSHVIEHVEDLESFMSELFRVSPKGYIEYPTVYYEYLYNFSVHINLLKKHDSCLYYLKKTDTTLREFVPVQRLFYRSLEQEYYSLVNSLRRFMFEGFEWMAPFEIRRADSINNLTWETLNIPKHQPAVKKRGLLHSLKRLYSGAKGK